MTDIVDSQRRSELMAGIKGKNTKPELIVRAMAHKLGLRFRLHRKDLPGRPDLVFPKYNLAIFVHGCFWHQHEGCSIAHIPKTRSDYWVEKFKRNICRDKQNEETLRSLGWHVLIIWECETGKPEMVQQRLAAAVRANCHSVAAKNYPFSLPKLAIGIAEPSALTRPPVFVDAFAGCGGLSLGLMRAGWKGLFAIEKDPFAFETLSANFPSPKGMYSYDWPDNIEKRAWDIHELLSTREEALASLAGKVDLLAGGPPCQGFSNAGRRKYDDPRNRLLEAYLQLVRILRPQLVLVENVRGIRSDFKTLEHQGIMNFAATLQEELSADYDVASTVIKAVDFGIPQNRPRFFLVGTLKSLNCGDQIAALFSDMEQQVVSFLSERKLPRYPTAKDAISDLEVAVNGAIPSTDTKGFEAISYKEAQTPFQTAMRDGYEGIPPDTRLARHQPEIRDRFKAIIKASREESRLNMSISAETRKAHGLKKMAIRVLDPSGPAPTITSLPDDLLHYSEPRTLTVRENARLQTFPDWFGFKGNYTTGGHRRRNEVPRFTQVANAVPPLLAEQLGFLLLGIACRLLDAELFPDRVAGNIEC